MLYTSGTTGKPKGAELSHSNMVMNALTSNRLFDSRPSVHDTHLLVLPLFHSFGQTVNLNAGFLLAQALAKHMVERQAKGRILFTTSLHAYSPRNLPHYSASKAAQTMVVRELARALGPHGIRVNAIAPGAVPGEGFKAKPGMADKIPLGRFGTPAEVAAMAVVVLSERFGSYVTGATMVVDGGIALHNWIDP